MTSRIYPIQTSLSNAYLLETGRGVILVDTGSPGSHMRILRYVNALGWGSLQLIFITHAHFDHYGSALTLRQLTGAPVAIHHADSSAMAMGLSPLGIVRGRGKLVKFVYPLIQRIYPPPPLQADICFSEGDDLSPYGIKAMIIHLPGHTPGSSGIFVENRSALVGDLITTTGRPHPQRYFAFDWNIIAESLMRLQRLAPQWIYTGHGRQVMSGAELQGLKI